MAVPKQRHTKSRRNKRRSQIYIKSPSLSECPRCRKPVLSHVACSNCGFYNKREVIDVLKKLKKKERKIKEKEIDAKENEENKGASKKPLSMEELSKK